MVKYYIIKLLLHLCFSLEIIVGQPNDEKGFV